MFSLPLYELCIHLKGFIKKHFHLFAFRRGGENNFFDVPKSFHITELNPVTMLSKSYDSHIP